MCGTHANTHADHIDELIHAHVDRIFISVFGKNEKRIITEKGIKLLDEARGKCS